MKERPIIFSAPMVTAILAGRKTQTRRIVKPQPDAGGLWPRGSPPGASSHDCEYGKPGDRLWVRETFSITGLQKYHYTGNPDDHGGPNDPCCAYAATATYKCGKKVPDGALAFGAHRWKSPIIMPRKLSRITLEVLHVRVQRLQDITEGDAIAEGVGSVTDPATGFDTWRAPFSTLWEVINGRDSWSANPWVWAITFRRLDETAHQQETAETAAR